METKCRVCIVFRIIFKLQQPSVEESLLTETDTDISAADSVSLFSSLTSAVSFSDFTHDMIKFTTVCGYYWRCMQVRHSSSNPLVLNQLFSTRRVF